MGGLVVVSPALLPTKVWYAADAASVRSKVDMLSASANPVHEAMLANSCAQDPSPLIRSAQDMASHAHPIDNPLGAICTECESGYVGSDCSLKCPNINSKGRPCGGQGKCMETNGVASCSCNEGFLGDGCEHDCPRDRAGRPCAAEGRCQVFGDRAQCECNDGFLGHNCDLVCPRHIDSKEVCSGHGDCVPGPDGAKADCECAPGYTGRSCNAGCPAGENNLSCSGHGSCEIVGTEGKCKCDDGFSGEDCGEYTCSSPNSVYNKVTAQCVCPVGSICCERKALEDKQAKEKQIRTLETQTQEINERIERATSLLARR